MLVPLASLLVMARAFEPDVQVDSTEPPEVPPPTDPAALPAPEDPEPEPFRVDHTDARVGFGFDFGGGGLAGLTTQIRIGRATWLDLGLHGRVAITPGDADDHTNALFSVGVVHDLGGASTRGALFASMGATPPGIYTDAYVAAGPAMRVWSRSRVVCNTFAIGPGWLFNRAIPDASPGPPFLIFLRYAVHFQRADSRMRAAREQP